jgi:hypothetical protein
VTHQKTSKREESRRRAALCGVTVGAIALGACQPQLEPGDYNFDSGVGAASGMGGVSGVGGTGVGTAGAPPGIIVIPSAGSGGGTQYLSPASGLTPLDLGTPPADPSCTAAATAAAGAGSTSGAAGTAGAQGNADGASAGPPQFCDQQVWNVAPAHRTLYSWTTADQVAELRSGRVLLTRTETPGLGRGYAFTSMDELAARGTAPENTLLQKLSNELFVKARYAWPSAWATRMGWPGEDYGDQLLRIVLKPEAWIVVVTDQEGIAVIDMNNELVSIADALAHVERIGAVYFLKRDVSGEGSFFSCSGGYREFIVGNEAMIEEWSLGTQEIHDRILADAELIETFFGTVRAAPPRVDAASFNQTVVCYWDRVGNADDLDRYQQSLSIPSEYYAPLPAQLANLSQTLRASLFDPDPLVVHPGESP